MANLISTISFGENEPASTFYKELENKNLDPRAIIMFSLAETTINHILITLNLPSNNEKMRPETILSNDKFMALQDYIRTPSKGSPRPIRTVVWARKEESKQFPMNPLIDTTFNHSRENRDVYSSTTLWLLGAQALVEFVAASKSTVK